jgi:transcriptional regulator with XRE-family HTH domain
MHKRAAYDLAIGLALRELQNEHDMGRERIAGALEVTELGVTRIETGEEPLTAGGLILLLGLFDMSWDAFMARVDRHRAQGESEILK